MGNYEHQKVSVIEEVLSNNKFLTYTDQYIGGGKGKMKGGVKAPVKGSKGMASTSRIVPARISKELTENIQITSKEVFRILNLSGIIVSISSQR